MQAGSDETYAYPNLGAVMAANKKAGQYFFSAGAHQFFDSRIESALIAGRYFVTSEQPPHGPRVFTARVALKNGHVWTLTGGSKLENLSDALAAIDLAQRRTLQGAPVLMRVAE